MKFLITFLKAGKLIKVEVIATGENNAINKVCLVEQVQEEDIQSCKLMNFHPKKMTVDYQNLSSVKHDINGIAKYFKSLNMQLPDHLRTEFVDNWGRLERAQENAAKCIHFSSYVYID